MENTIQSYIILQRGKKWSGRSGVKTRMKSSHFQRQKIWHGTDVRKPQIGPRKWQKTNRTPPLFDKDCRHPATILEVTGEQAIQQLRLQHLVETKNPALLGVGGGV
jgi:hypothetical protein